MSLRIGFDLDGVLADMESELIRQAGILFGEAVVLELQARAQQAPVPAPAAAVPASGIPLKPAQKENVQAPRFLTMELNARQERRLWRHVASIDGFWETLKEIESGVVAQIDALARERRWEIIFLTKRPESAGATAQVQTQRWLQAHGFALPSVFVVQGSRGRIADALNLDFVVDDRPENCLDVVIDSKARALLVWRGDEQQLPATARRLGIGPVKSVAECLDILTRVQETQPPRPGLLDRVKRRLGLTEPARA